MFNTCGVLVITYHRLPVLLFFFFSLLSVINPHLKFLATTNDKFDESRFGIRTHVGSRTRLAQSRGSGDPSCKKLLREGQSKLSRDGASGALFGNLLSTFSPATVSQNCFNDWNAGASSCFAQFSLPPPLF